MSQNIIKKSISSKQKGPISRKRNDQDLSSKAIDVAFKDNYGIFMAWGGLYRGNLTHSIFYVCWTGLHIGFLGYTICISWDDLGILFEAAHFIVMLTNACVAVVNIRYHKDNIEFMLKCIGNQFFDYGQTIDSKIEEQIKEIRRRWKRIKLALARTFSSGVVIVGLFLTVARPLYDIAIGNYSKKNRNDGIIRTLPVAFWFPIQAEGLWIEITAALSEYYIIAITMGVVLGFDVSFLCFSHELSTEFQVLSLTVKTFDQRAMILYKRLYGSKLPENLKNDFYFNKCIEKCMSESVKHHQLLLKYFSCHYAVNYIMLLALLLGATFMICLSGFIFTTDGVELSSKLTFLLFLVIELCHTFIFCWYGELIYQMNNNLGDEFYGSNWTLHSKTLKSYMLIMKARCNNPLRMSAGGYLQVSLDTFSNVVSTAYSYFNLLRAVRE